MCTRTAERMSFRQVELFSDESMGVSSSNFAAIFFVFFLCFAEAF